MKDILFASNNKHKVIEVKQILSKYKIYTLEDIGFIDDIVEDGKTFFDNALIKARAASEYCKEKGLDYIVIADDSGLVVDALNGEPGVYSARYAGDHNSQSNRNKILTLMKDIKNRKAKFVCCMVAMYKDKYISAIGEVKGTITYKEIGDTSFGYDPIFYSDELGKTFGEASENEKNSISHRGRALRKLKNIEKKLKIS